LIKTAVGLNTHDLIGEIKLQKTEVQQLKETLQGVMAYLKQKDPEFKLSMPLSQDSYAATTSGALPSLPKSIQPKSSFSSGDLSDVYELLRENPEYVDKVLNRAKEICISRGMDLNKEFAKGFFDRETFFRKVESAITLKAAPQKTKVPVISEKIPKRFEPIIEKN